MFSSSSESRWSLLRSFSCLGRKIWRRSGNTIRLRTGKVKKLKILNIIILSYKAISISLYVY